MNSLLEIKTPKKNLIAFLAIVGKPINSTNETLSENCYLSLI
jgi:hypothetical protein